MRKKYIHLKSDLAIEDLQYMHPNLLLILAFINSFCHNNDIKFQLTSMYRTEEQNRKVGAKSKTHVEDRAFDFSIRKEHGWTYEKIQELVNSIHEYTERDPETGKYKRVFMDNGAKVWADKNKTILMSRPIVIHKVKGGVTHAHVQVKP